MTCRYCKEEGHFIKDCPKKALSLCHNCGFLELFQEKINFFIGKEGHFAKDCTEPRKKRVCFKCGSFGHFTKDCVIRERIICNNLDAEEGEMGEIGEIGEI